MGVYNWSASRLMGRHPLPYKLSIPDSLSSASSFCGLSVMRVVHTDHVMTERLCVLT